MTLDPAVRKSIIHNAALSLLLYASPVLLMLLVGSLTGRLSGSGWGPARHASPGAIEVFFQHLSAYGLTLFVLGLGVIEFATGLYENHWSRNERFLDIACFAAPHLITKPLTAYLGLKLLPLLLPGMKNMLGWVPFFWGFLIICVADDLTQYWYHRLHHQLPWLWRFHRTHHSAPYMGMAMSGRQNIIYTFFFSHTWLVIALVYLGLGAPALFVLVFKSIIVTLAHSSIPWDRPLYRHRYLHPVAWVLERLISTPATHHAHHSNSTDDGVGYYKGNFGNMFFLWDVIFGTAHISRQYPESYGISHYEGDEWYAQMFWPIFKSSVRGSELAADGPMVRMDDPREDAVSVETTSFASGQIAASVG